MIAVKVRDLDYEKPINMFCIFIFAQSTCEIKSSFLKVIYEN